jgi:hypothetical protein
MRFQWDDLVDSKNLLISEHLPVENLNNDTQFGEKVVLDTPKNRLEEFFRVFTSPKLVHHLLHLSVLERVEDVDVGLVLFG